MRYSFLLTFVSALLTLGAGPSVAQLAAPDAELTREQWNERVDAARHRSQEYIANLRTTVPAPPSRFQMEKQAAERAMNDPTLRPGDVVSTGRGLVVFTGNGEERRSSDFRPLSPSSPRP